MASKSKRKDKPIIRILLNGYAVLIAAIVLNFLAKAVGLQTWYDLFFGEGVSIVSWAFMLVIYPALLGLTCFYADRLIR